MWETSFCSELNVLADGRMVEVAKIGREGAVGLLGDLGDDPVSSATMVQAATSTSVKMPTNAFRHEMDQRGAFFDLISQSLASRAVSHAHGRSSNDDGRRTRKAEEAAAAF